MKQIFPYGILLSIIFYTGGNVYGQCTADFKVQGKLCDGSTTLFKATDTTKTLSYDWNFGDIFSGTDNLDTLQNPSHLFTNNGTYTIRLIVKDTNACKDTFYKTITIFAKPKADFIWQNGCSNLLTVFRDSSKADAGDTLKSWNWDMGNSSTSALKNPTVSYTSAGNYSVKLKIITSAGCIDSIKKNVTIFKTPTAKSDLTQACKNAQVNFVADTLSKAISYNWDFGDSSYFPVRTASHIYKKTGFVFPLLTVDFGSTKCTIKLDSIHIHPLPDATFLSLNDTQCFNQNNVCVKLINNKQKLKSRTVIFDDGYFDDFTPLSDSIVCHKYTDPNGANYTITMEIIDSNNCFASFTALNPVVIFPQVISDFSFTGGTGCFNAKVNITNTSNESPPIVTKFIWDFGDGTKDSTNWTNFGYTYTSTGTFKITLFIKDKNGCPHSYTNAGTVSNTSFKMDAIIDSSYGKCRSDNYYHFKQTPISGATILWTFTPTASSTSFSTQYRFPNSGLFYPTVTISKNGCDSTITLDSVVVHGPIAAIGSVINQYQCQVKDTVYYTNNSILFRNKNVLAKWDAGDVFAPNCTLITKDSINIGQNCNYSRDPLFFKHKYKKGQEACYFTKLVVMDTAVGCSDSVLVAVPLMPPKAKGLFTPSNTTPCPGPEGYKMLTFNLNQSQPSCLKYAWWLMWDSLRAEQTGNFDSCWSPNSVGHNYPYSKYAGDSAGNVSIGLIVENGRDTNGRVCRDTGWFHHSVVVTQMSPVFSSNYNPIKYYCPNSGFRFFPADSNQTSGTRFLWNFGDGNFIDTTDQHSVFHVFKKARKYQVTLSVMNPNGCSGNTFITINIGVYKNFSLSSNFHCVRDSIQLFELNEYYDTLSNVVGFWSDPLRASAGKEQVRFDLGDGKGFKNIGANPKISYPYPGTYDISMAIKDSAGCWDTVSAYKTVNVSGIYADFSLPDDSLLCAQTLDLKSLSTTVDSTVMKGLAGDVVKTWVWDFGTKYAKSYISNPRRNFAIGDYNIKLKVSNTFGCTDSITKDLVLIGPKAYFDFVNDTVGCEPLQITFKNKSVNATDFIWLFNDKSKSAFATSSDTNISFNYVGNGNFYPQLIARGLFTKKGISQVCEDIYPDTSFSFKRTVTVWELPKPAFRWFTNCSNSTTTFINTSTISTGSIIASKWFFGDGTNSINPNPVHTYADTGNYRVVLKVFSNMGCEDSLVRNIMVSLAPFANFTFNNTCKGSQTFFKDSSFAYNDKIYLWRWNFGDGTNSNLKNPSKTFALDTTYFVKLKITNVAGCSDSIIKPITIYSNPKPDFSFGNVCNKSKMAFTNNSTSKQTLQSWVWNFGDGNNSVSWNTNYTYSGAGNYNVKLKLTTIWGCKDSVVKTVTVYPNPVAKININQKNQCYKYHTFNFTDSSKIASGTTTSYWNLGNSDSSKQNSFSYRYAGYGNYGIRLISISGFNCRDTVYDSVRVFASPVANFSVNQNNQCSRYNSYNFNDLGNIAKGSYTRQWQYGDGKFSTSNPATYHYTDTGIFTPLLILTSNLGCKDTAVSAVRLWPMPAARFTINDSDQCLTNNNFIFTNNSTVAWGSLSSRWEFGDAAIFNGLNATHSYASPNTFTVLLQVTSVNNCIDTIRKSVVVYPMPKAGFKIDDSTQCLKGNVFNFTDKSSISSGTMSRKWYFGDASTSVLTNPQHSFATFGTYNVKLVIQSASSCPDSVTQTLIVYPMPVVKPIVNFNNGCINNQRFQFTDSSSIAYGNLSRIWKFGDSTTSSVQNPFKTFALAKTYTVWLKETSDFGCVDSAFESIIIYPKPKVSFSVNDSTQCLTGNNFVFKNNSSIQSGSLTQTWRFGDGKTKTTTDAANTYNTYGNFKVTLIPVSNFGCTDSASALMTVYSMPVPDFSINKFEQCVRQNQFIFTNNSTIFSGSLTHSWKFGDTGVLVSASPTYVYSKTGTFMVRLKSTSNFGCVDSISDLVIVNPMPVSNFNINDSTQCINNQNFIFTDISSIFSGALTRNWKFGDGSFSNLSPVTKTFVKDTIFFVKLIQTSNRGCTDSISKIIEVYSKPNLNYNINATDQCLKQNNFVFTNNSSIRKGILAHQWNFGDLATSSLTGPAHRYVAFGSYTVKLITTSDNGCVDSLKKPVRVDPMPVVIFTVNDTGQCINNQRFVFTNISSIPVGTIQYLWKFGDGSSSILKDPVKQYTKDTSYRVLLTVTSAKGCKDSLQKIMDVYPKPKVYFSIDDSIQCLFQNVFGFTNKSTIKYGTLTYTWNFGDGNSSNATNTSHSYLNFGNKNVKLKSVSNLGCEDSITKIITVAAMPVVNFRINDAGQCFRIQNFIFTNTSTLASGTMRSIWYFGDLDTLSSINASHIYKSIRNYKPKVIVTTNYGCKDSISHDVWVNPNAKAAFTTNDSTQCINEQNYIFTNTSTVNPGQIKSLLWNLGNGKTSNQQTVNSYYPKSGFYTIILQTTTDSGCIDSFKNQIRVYPKPIAWFNVNDSAQCLFQNKYLFTNFSFDSIGFSQYNWYINAESHQWTQQANYVANYVFNTSGFKIINLIATSTRGCSDTVQRQVYVKPMPNPNFEPLKKCYCHFTGPYNFTPITAGGTFYGKNIQSNTYNPVILWEDSVKYVVTVNGCTDSSTQLTQVYPGPEVNLGNDTFLCKYEALELVVNSWQSRYVWNDGSTGNYLRVLDPGIYSVIVTNMCGVKGDTIQVSYHPVNCRFFLPTAFSPNGDGLNDRFKPLIYDVREMNYKIFNRWGELLYEGNETDPGWDGTSKDEMVQLGNYLVHATYSYSSGNRYIKITESGMFLLVR